MLRCQLAAIASLSWLFKVKSECLVSFYYLAQLADRFGRNFEKYSGFLFVSFGREVCLTWNRNWYSSQS